MAATSADVKSLPSCHFTPWRSWNVQTVPSSLGSHDSARPGASSPSSPSVVRNSKHWAISPYVPRSCMLIGSSGPAGVW